MSGEQTRPPYALRMSGEQTRPPYTLILSAQHAQRACEQSKDTILHIARLTAVVLIIR